MSVILLALIAAVVSQVVGFLWHGPLFATRWARAQDIPMADKPPKAFPYYLLINFVMNFIMALVLFYFMSGFAFLTLGQALKFSAVLFIGFIIPIQTIGIVWNGRRPKGQLTVWLISIGYQIISLFLWAVLFTWLR